ncbi:MAG: YqaJ viral recombinase family protein [Oscillospiraceae bacterium]|nr:YqaJ viral recombinase family protein [Oscillospiraceae bacterium]
MAKVVVNTENLSYEEWLEYRKTGIGGSDASVVCGINKYKSPIELWMEKTGQLPYQEAGEAAYWGTQLEGLVRSEFTKRTGIEVKLVKQLIQSEEYPFMQANLDGICEHPEHGTCIFEAKTASAYKVSEWENSIPAEYMLQIQHYMAVTDYKGTYIAVLIGGNTFKWKFIERDDEMIAMLISLEADFWEHIKSKTPPPLDGSDASAKFLSDRFPESVSGTQIVLPENADTILKEYDAACEQLSEVTERKQKAENLLKDMLGNNEVGTFGDRVISWKSMSQERLDTKALKANYPELFKEYANRISFRKFSVKAV